MILQFCPTGSLDMEKEEINLDFELFIFENIADQHGSDVFYLKKEKEIDIASIAIVLFPLSLGRFLVLQMVPTITLISIPKGVRQLIERKAGEATEQNGGKE